MTASETGREIPADVRALTRRLRLMPDKAKLAGAFEADCCAAADLIEAQAARIASLEAAGCMCRDVPIGSHKASVVMELPDHMAATRVARVEAGLSPNIALDACLVEEVRDLWSRGIYTTGCCCGHNRMAGYIGVEVSDIPAMKAMGYVVRENASRLGDEDSFVPKSVRLSASLEAERARTVEDPSYAARFNRLNAIVHRILWIDLGLPAMTNIQTQQALTELSQYLLSDALDEALALALASEKGGQADG